MVPKKEAKKIAAKELRFNVVHLPHLGDAEYVSGRGFVFPIKFTKPELPSREEIDDPNIEQSVEFYETQQIGELVVTDDGEIIRSSNDELNAAIKSLEKSIEKGEIKKK